MQARPNSAARWPVLALLALSACGPEREEPYVDHAPGVLRQGMTVDDVTGCDTSLVNGLTVQLVAELNCIAPESMVDFSGPDTTRSAAVQPYLEPAAAAALHAATAQQGEVLDVTSAYRSVAQQYLLYKWWQAGQCGIQAAATPGSSNHQSGRAIDTPSYSHWNAALTAAGWTWFGSGDTVHFDFTSAPDLRSNSVLAFQRLWNKNNAPPLDEDGVWGPATEGAMKGSPPQGFAIFGCATSSSTGSAGSAGSSTGGTTGSAASSTGGVGSTTGGTGSSSSSTGSLGSSSTGGQPGLTRPQVSGKLPAKSGCQQAPGELGLAALAATLARRRRLTR